MKKERLRKGNVLVILSFQDHRFIIWVYKFRFCREIQYSAVLIEPIPYTRWYYKCALNCETFMLGNLFCSLQLVLCVP